MKKSDDDAPARPYIPPVMTLGRRVDISNALARHVEANRSDPFAGGRIKMHMERGLELPSDVLEEANSKLNANRGR